MLHSVPRLRFILGRTKFNFHLVANDRAALNALGVEGVLAEVCGTAVHQTAAVPPCVFSEHRWVVCELPYIGCTLDFWIQRPYAWLKYIAGR